MRENDSKKVKRKQNIIAWLLILLNVRRCKSWALKTCLFFSIFIMNHQQIRISLDWVTDTQEMNIKRKNYHFVPKTLNDSIKLLSLKFKFSNQHEWIWRENCVFFIRIESRKKDTFPPTFSKFGRRSINAFQNRKVYIIQFCYILSAFEWIT